jgi:hypothetical protein
MGTESPYYPDWMSDAAVERRKRRFLGCLAAGAVLVPLAFGLVILLVWLLIGNYRYFNAPKSRLSPPPTHVPSSRRPGG